MKIKKDIPAPIGIQLAPMIDMVFLLLIFFIMTWQFSRDETELKLVLPKAEKNPEAKPAESEILIQVLANGTMKVDNTDVTSVKLAQSLSEIAKQYPDQAVRIRGDAQVEYQHIISVVDLCQKSGLKNIAFATQKNNKP